MASKFSLEAIFRATDKLSAPIVKMAARVGAFGRSAEGAFRSLNRTVDRGLAGIGKFSNALGIAGVASVAGLTYQLKDIIQQGAEFEQVLIRTGTAFEKPVRKGTEGFARLVAAARMVGQTTEFSSLQAAEALNSLATAGYTAEQSIAALPRIIDFASAAGVELAQASDITSDALGAFSLRSADATENARNMGRIMDSLTRAAADSTTNVVELFEGIRMGGSFAATSGASIEQFTAMLGILGNAGIKGTEAGTAIRNSFLHLTQVTPVASKTMARLGIQIARTEDGAIDMAGTIGRFAKATQGLTKAQKAQAVATVFGAYTVGPFLTLMNAGEPALRRWTKNMERAGGTTKTMAETMRGSTTARLQQFFNVISGVKLSIFDAISDTVLDIAESVGKWVAANQQLIATKADEWAVKLKDALPEIWVWTERITKALAGFLVLSAVVKTVSLLATVAGGLATMFAWAEFTALLLGTTLGAVVWPIVLIGAAIAGLAALAWKFWPEITGFFTGVKDWAVKAISGMWEWIKGVFSANLGFLTASFEFVVGLLSVLFGPQIAAAKWFMGAIAGLVGAAVEWVKGIWAPLSDWFAGVWSSMLVALDEFIVKFKAVWAPIATFFSGLWKGIVDTFWGFIDPILGGAKRIVDLVRTVGRLTLGTADEEGGAVPTARPGEGPQIVTPGERAAREARDGADGEATVDGKIVVEAKPGTRAQVKTKSRKVELRQHPSGAF